MAPLINTVAPERVVEIGALRGETTARLLESLAADAELHVIDPNPQFDPSDHERRWAGRYVFHRDISLNVLPELAPDAVALVDGDHNWYAVSNELRLLRDRARQAARPAPVVVLHDVGWPYERRDGYYAPERVPASFRHLCARRGLERGRPGLLPHGGVNRNLWNAEFAGGPRNGVLTALEDFSDDPASCFRHVVIEVSAGPPVAAEKERLALQPRIAKLLDLRTTEPEQPGVRAAADGVVRETVAADTLTLD